MDTEDGPILSKSCQPSFGFSETENGHFRQISFSFLLPHVSHFPSRFLTPSSIDYILIGHFVQPTPKFLYSRSFQSFNVIKIDVEYEIYKEFRNVVFNRPKPHTVRKPRNNVEVFGYWVFSTLLWRPLSQTQIFLEDFFQNPSVCAPPLRIQIFPFSMKE